MFNPINRTDSGAVDVRRLLVPFLSLVVLFSVVAKPVFGAGLLIPTEGNTSDLRIVDHHVGVRIADQLAYTTVNQVFENMTDRRLEGTYIFPIPNGADITDFQMTFNGKMVQGEVLPADEARKIYESIVRRERDPGLIEFIGRRLLRARVFPIEPKSKTEIQISYQQITEPMSGMRRYVYPLHTPGRAGHVYGTLGFKVNLESKAPLRAIWSPTHEVEVIRDGDHAAMVAYEKSGASLNDDFMLLYDTDDQDVGLSLATFRENEVDPGFFMMLLSPKSLWEDEVEVPQDYVFVVDTSGSMAGEKIDQVRKALKYCINMLDESDRFSIVRFSTSFDMMFDGLVSADAKTKSSAIKAVEGYRATGGTNIHDALKAAVAMRDTSSDRPFVVIFLTDGQGDRDREVIEKMLGQETYAYKDEVRLFPFGVGHDVNTKLLDSLSTNYGGLPTYVQPGENLEYVLGDFFGVFSQPVLTNLKLTLPDAVITDQFPPQVGDLYHGKQLVLVGRYEEDVVGSIVLKGKRGDRDVQYAWQEVSFKPAAKTEDIARIWAGRKIAYLIDRIRLVGESDELVDEVLTLSQKYGIQTPYSSWLVVPEGQGGWDSRPGRPIRLSDAPAMRGRNARYEQSFDMLGSVAAEEMEQAPVDQEGVQWDDDGLMFDAGSARKAAGAKGGSTANQIAVHNQRLRDNVVAGVELRQDIRRQLVQNIAGQDFFNIQGILADSRFTDDSEILEIQFGSNAYFDLALNRADLRPVLAAATYVIVQVNDDLAVFIRDTEGVEDLTDEQRSQLW